MREMWPQSSLALAIPALTAGSPHITRAGGLFFKLNFSSAPCAASYLWLDHFGHQLGTQKMWSLRCRFSRNSSDAHRWVDCRVPSKALLPAAAILTAAGKQKDSTPSAHGEGPCRRFPISPYKLCPL